MRVSESSHVERCFFTSSVRTNLWHNLLIPFKLVYKVSSLQTLVQVKTNKSIKSNIQLGPNFLHGLYVIFLIIVINILHHTLHQILALHAVQNIGQQAGEVPQHWYVASKSFLCCHILPHKMILFDWCSDVVIQNISAINLKVIQCRNK